MARIKWNNRKNLQEGRKTGNIRNKYKRDTKFKFIPAIQTIALYMDGLSPQLIHWLQNPLYFLQKI